MLDLNDLRLFVQIVDHQGLLKAGRALGLPKSTISRRLAGLEEHLKARLIMRSGEDFRLTAAGEKAYAVGRAMVEAARRAEEELLRPQDLVGGKVRVSVSPVFEPCLPDYLADLTRDHPRLALLLDVGIRELDHAGDGFDLHLVAHHWPLRDSALIQRRICRNAMVLVATPEIVAGIEEHHTTMPAEVGFYAYGVDQGLPALPLAEPRLVTASTALLRSLALGGAGAVLLPEFAVRAELAGGALRELNSGLQGAAVTVTLLSPPRRLMNATLRHVADTLGASVKASILPPGSSVPELEPAVPSGHDRNVTQLSSPAPSQIGRAAGAGNGAHFPNQVESETDMNPLLKTIGAAAIGAAAALPAAAQDIPGPLVLYTNDFEGVITERFEADTGREIDVVQMSGGEILARIAAEASNPQWDVLIFNGSYSFHGLDKQEQLLRGVEPANLDNLNEIGRAHLPENLSWFPIGLAASCVMLYRTDLVDTPPSSFADLADPAYNGQFGMADPAVAAPAYPCVAEFFNELGNDEAEAYFTSLFDNGLRVYRTNGPIGQALTSGDLSLALITGQVAYSLKASGDAPVEVVWPEEGAPGVVRGVGIQASSARPEAAKAFVEWLLEPDTQSYLAASVPSDGIFEPTVTGALRRDDGPQEGRVYRVAPDDFAVANEAEIKTWFADRALN